MLDKDSHLPTDGLDTDGKKGSVEQEVLGLLRCVVAKDGGLDGSTEGDGLIGVDRRVWLRCH